MTSLYREITACRACGSDRLEEVLDLGNLAISDFPLPGAGEPDRAPLTLVQCQDCTLVQLRHTVDRNRLYRNYYYRSGTNESMVRALREIAEEAMRRVTLGAGDAVLDIGANDCTLLRMFPDTLWRKGYEPAKNLMPEYIADRNLNLVNAYFPPPSGERSAFAGDYRIITSIAVFYDVDDPAAFVAAIKDWLHPEGVWVVQFQDLHAMLAVNGFDNICHEHLTYWSIRPLRMLLERHGLRIDGASHNATNGGSIRLIVRHGPVREPDPPGRYQCHDTAVRLCGFAQEVERLRNDTVTLLRDLQARGKQVLGYAASTKANTLLQYYGIGPDLLPAIADRNPEKWGRQTVTGIPIISEEEMRARRPDYLVALAWHFLEPFRQREADFEARGGKWVVPLPHLRIVGGDDDASLQPPRLAPGAGCLLA